MTKTEVMKELRATGSAQTRKIIRRHGAEGDTFGVSYAFLGKMKRKIKTDQRLAEQLWATGNVDARVLATLICDPEQLTATKAALARPLEGRHEARVVTEGVDIMLVLDTSSSMLEEGLERGFCLQGNHEYALLNSAEDFNPKARQAIEWTRAELNAGDDRERYYTDKRASYPPDCEREAGKDYSFRV